MRQRIRSVLALLLLVGPGLQAATKPVPAQLSHARYIALGYDTGDSFLSEEDAIARPADILPADLRALSAVRDQLETWEKYVITVRPEQAELLVAVRTGRRLVIGAGTPVRGGAAAGPAGALGAAGGAATGMTSYGGQLSSQGDMLTVYESRGGRPGMLLWRERLTPGFPSRLFDQFKADVERSAARAKKP